MNQCNKCGQSNAKESNFCRFCGAKIFAVPPGQFNPPQPFPQSKPKNSDFEYSPPRPHVWKTDEFQVQENKARPTQEINRVQPLANFNPQAAPNPGPQHLAHYQGSNIAHGYRCPRCSSQLLPRIERKISTPGWVVFALFIVFFFPLFWVGLLIKEDVRVCPVCSLRIN